MERRNVAGAAIQALPPGDRLAAELESARAVSTEARARHAEARAFARNLARELEARAARRRVVEEERSSWAERRGKAEAHIGEISERRSGAEEELEGLDAAPAEFAAQRRALLSQLSEAEAARAAAADERAAAETRLADADRAARAALEAMSNSREQRAAAESRVEAARDAARGTAEDHRHGAGERPAVAAGARRGQTRGEAAGRRRRRQAARKPEGRARAARRGQSARRRGTRRDREPRAKRWRPSSADLAEAIKRLRSAISSLNAEGRERLLAAFTVVNKHFGELFQTLFEGGTAELQLIESDDPLEAGLELVARPPGKKPQTLTLLSGGEQALTATALIFAVFLTNPSPICVLDEIDAPLDDYNVERFCDLLDEMRKRADTRFVTITHNPVTMARMDRLFGVTMPERGVSQIVSVDLATAESFLEAS